MCYCPGCSHGLILERLATAIQRAGTPPARVCVVTDIGCIGTADRYWGCHTFHGLHGRSITYAEGIKRARPDVTVIVLIGDGGCGIGTAHLVHAARRNADIKVLVANNFNFGMTGGQHSPTTPEDAWTATTHGQHTEHPFDICRTVAVNGAGFVARCSALDDQATDLIELALRAPGFALVDLWELCVAYFVPANKLKPQGLPELAARLDMPFGILRNEPMPAPRDTGKPIFHPPPPAAIVPRLQWPGRREVCIAGSAGQHIRTAAGIIGELAVAGGLFAAQQDDFPITVRRGHSVSNLVVDNQPIEYTGVDHPDLLIALSLEGVRHLDAETMSRSRFHVVADPAISLPWNAQTAVPFSVKELEHCAGKNAAALAALTLGILSAGWMGDDVLLAAADAGLHGRFRDENLKAIGVAVDLHGGEFTCKSTNAPPARSAPIGRTVP